MDENQQTTPVDQSSTDEQEWAAAFDSYKSDHGIKPTESEEKLKKTDVKAEESTKDKDEAPALPDGDKDDKDDEEFEAQVTTEDNSALRDARSVQRQIQEDRQTMISDVREQLFSDAPTELRDADGDPIRTIEDVMRMVNPKTVTEETPEGRAFTEEEAASWLLTNQQKLERMRDETERKIEHIAEVNLDIKDQADSIRGKWGELLKSMPDVAKSIKEAFEKTLTIDEKTNIITDAPVNMEQFYDIALAGYAKANEAEQSRVEVEADASKKIAKVKSVNDRSDIYSGGKTEDNKTDEEREWEQAFERHYEGSK